MASTRTYVYSPFGHDWKKLFLNCARLTLDRLHSPPHFIHTYICVTLIRGITDLGGGTKYELLKSHISRFLKVFSCPQNEQRNCNQNLLNFFEYVHMYDCVMRNSNSCKFRCKNNNIFRIKS